MTTTMTLAGHPAPYAMTYTAEAVKKYLQENAPPIGRSPRYLQLARYDAHFEAEQYAHQKLDWWGRNADIAETISPLVNVPPGFQMIENKECKVRDKRPTAPMNSARAITKRYTQLLLSRSRRPRVQLPADPDSEAFLSAVFTQSKFWQVLKIARNKGGACGSVAMTVHLRDGRFVYEAHSAKDVTMVWKDRRTWTPCGMMIAFRYDVEVVQRDSKGQYLRTINVPYLYRRVITEVDDTVFVPVQADVYPLRWDPEPSLSVTHGLNIFPGIWIQNQANTDDMDGEPDSEGAWQMFDTIDRLNAQSNKALLHNQDPTVVLKYDSKEVAAGGPVITGSDHTLNVGKSGDAKLMEMEAGGIEQSGKFSDRLEEGIQRVTGMRFPTAEKMSGSAQSARAMEFLMEPTLEVTDDLREQYGDAVRSLADITLQVARKFQNATGLTTVEGRPIQFAFDLPAKRVPITQGGDQVRDAAGEEMYASEPQKVGPGGPIEIKWGDYFPLTEGDKQQKIANAVAANVGGAIDVETMVADIAPLFGVDDLQTMVRNVKAENEERMSRALAAAGSDPYGGVPPPPQPDRRGGPGENAGETATPAAGQGGRP